MKKITTKIFLSMGCAVLCSSCANTYIHNTVKAPIFADSTKAELSASVGMRHLELNLAYKTKTNMFLICNTYLGNKQYRSFDIDRQLFADAGLGFVKKSQGKTYIGTYFTVGGGTSKFISDNVDIYTESGKLFNAFYYRLAMTNYFKIDGKHARFQLALRTSMVKFPDQKRYVQYKITDGYFFTSTNYESMGPYMKEGYTDLLSELSIGYDIKITKNFCFFMQSNIAMPLIFGDKVANTAYNGPDAVYGAGQNDYRYSKLNMYSYVTNKLGFEFYFR
jgi:hypothetical protein